MKTKTQNNDLGGLTPLTNNSSKNEIRMTITSFGKIFYTNERIVSAGPLMDKYEVDLSGQGSSNELACSQACVRSCFAGNDNFPSFN